MSKTVKSLPFISENVLTERSDKKIEKKRSVKVIEKVVKSEKTPEKPKIFGIID